MIPRRSTELAEALISIESDGDSSRRQPSQQAKKSTESKRAARPVAPAVQAPHRAPDVMA
jgi:hypothetical protein